MPIGHCHLRNHIRLFKVQLAPVGGGDWRVLLPPGRLQGQGLHGGTLRTILGDGDFHVVLRFTQAYAGRIAEKQWHASQVVEPQPDGTLIPAHNINSILPARPQK